MMLLKILTDGSNNFTKYIGNSNSTGKSGSGSPNSSFWNSQALNGLITGAGHLFTKIWLLVHIIAIIGLITSFMIQAKGDASDKEDWFARGKSMGRYIYMSVIGIDVMTVFAIALSQLKFTTVLTLLISVALFVGYQFVVPMMLADSLNEFFIGSLILDPRKGQQGEQEIRLLRNSLYVGAIGLALIVVLVALF